MLRSRITRARQCAKTLAATVPGIDASFINIGVVAPDSVEDDEDFFKSLRSKIPLSIAYDSGTHVVTVTFAANHSFKVAQKVIVSLNAYTTDHAVAITAVTDTTLSFVNPELSVSVFAVAEGDLVYTISLVIKAATPVSFNVQELIGESTVDVLLYFGIEYASQTFIALESLAMNLRDILADQSSWSSANNDGPDDLKMDEPRLMRKDNPVPGYYKITLVFNGV